MGLAVIETVIVTCSDGVAPAVIEHTAFAGVFQQEEQQAAREQLVAVAWN